MTETCASHSDLLMAFIVLMIVFAITAFKVISMDIRLARIERLTGARDD